jgi:hypothetical protein
MSLGVRILSINLSGQSSEVTYLPDTGGTINLGTQVIPFNYISEYFYGVYEIYVPTYDYTYSLLVPKPTPTPTTTLTPTQTPTNTPTSTTTLTATPTQTPTNTPTSTTTLTATQTLTLEPVECLDLLAEVLEGEESGTVTYTECEGMETVTVTVTTPYSFCAISGTITQTNCEVSIIGFC